MKRYTAQSAVEAILDQSPLKSRTAMAYDHTDPKFDANPYESDDLWPECETCVANEYCSGDPGPSCPHAMAHKGD